MSSVIVNGARTPMGRLLGALKDLPATKLGSVAIKAALERSGVAPDQVQYVIMGHMALDGLTDAYDEVSMGESTERHTAKVGISRADQDAFGAASHQRAAAAEKKGVFAEEIAPVEIPQRRGEPLVVTDDEQI